MFLYRRFILALVFISFLACQQKDEAISTASVNPGSKNAAFSQQKVPFLSLSDFDPHPNMPALSQQEAKLELESFLDLQFSVNDFKFSVDDYVISEDDSDKSESGSSDDSISYDFKAVGNSITLFIVDESDDDFGKFFIQIICPSGDISSLSGKNISEDRDFISDVIERQCSDSMIVTQAFRGRAHTLYEGEIINKKVYLSYQGQSDLSLASIQPQQGIIRYPKNYILHFDKQWPVNEKDRIALPTKDYTYRNITSTSETGVHIGSDYLFTQGSVNITLDNWQGTLTIEKNATDQITAIVYKLLDQSGGQLSGSWPWSPELPQPGLSLKNNRRGVKKSSSKKHKWFQLLKTKGFKSHMKKNISSP